MTKSVIWNQLKSLGYTAQQLKAELNLTYAQVTKNELEIVLSLYTYEISDKDSEQITNDLTDWLEMINTDDNYQLTPKVQLFSSIVEYTFLMTCYLEVLQYITVTPMHGTFKDIHHCVYLSWCSITTLCFKSYVYMPLVKTKLLLDMIDRSYKEPQQYAEVI